MPSRISQNSFHLLLGKGCGWQRYASQPVKSLKQVPAFYKAGVITEMIWVRFMVGGRYSVCQVWVAPNPVPPATDTLLAKFLLKGKRGGVVEKAQRVKIAFLVVVSCPHCDARAGDRHSCEENGEKIIHCVSDRQPWFYKRTAIWARIASTFTAHLGMVVSLGCSQPGFMAPVGRMGDLDPNKAISPPNLQYMATVRGNMSFSYISIPHEHTLCGTQCIFEYQCQLFFFRTHKSSVWNQPVLITLH